MISPPPRSRGKLLAIAQAEVFEVDISLREEPPRRLDKGVDETVVLLSSYPLLSEAKVKRIFEKGLVVRPAIQNNRKGPVWVDARAESGEYQLCDRDEDSAAALVPNSQDLLAIWKLVSYDSCRTPDQRGREPVTTT